MFVGEYNHDGVHRVWLIVWTNLGVGVNGIPVGGLGDDDMNFDASAVIHYTLAVPEPGIPVLILVAICGIAARRQR